MKLSCLPVSYFQEVTAEEKTIAGWAREGKNLGLDGIDISVLFIKNKNNSQLEKIREELDSIGMGIIVTTTYPDFTHSDPIQRERELTRFLGDLTALSILGTRYVRITSGQGHPEVRRKEGVKWALEGILKSVETAEKLGIGLLFENHAKPGVWEYPDFAFPTDIFLEIAGELKNTPVKILFDTANPVAFGDDPVKLLDKVIERTACIHVADTGTRGTLTPVLIGTGLVPFKEVFQTLLDYPYKGWLCIEEASRMGEEGVRKAVDFVRENCLNRI